MSGYSEVTKRLYNELRHTLENSFLVRTYKTSTQGLRMYRGEAPGQGGGDGFRYIGELIRSTRREALPTFVIYLTDSGADLELTHSNLLTYKILMVDVTAPWITGSGSPNLDQKAHQIIDAVLEECCLDDEYHDEECEATYCGVSVRAELGAEIVQKIKRIIEGNSLTPTQQIRVKATRYRMFTECMGMSHETAHISAFQLPLPVSTTQHLDFDHTLYIREAPGGPSMSQSQITTTVSMQVRDSQRATLKDLKTLITEVERVGGTDESYVDINRLHSACLDAVVVTAVQVTEPDLDPTVACALTIEDAAVKVNTLIDLTVNGGRTVREQARKALTDLTTAATAKPAKSAKKATAAKPAAKA
jgi:hypothetical protein